ncbi:unnamed protein product [Arabis nemorensis]|uniref:Fe2OG dioxygenase domain-containing protein n=1 Tax=Arabis nemorensis TaxID=586526 RepID=A0A565CSS3_9BRAS|nr:unnamed protein product [Arabis nemorensis]
MASETLLCLPIIDFSNQNLKPGEPEWDLTRAHVLKALQDYGCFEASFDEVPFELRKSMFEAIEELFDLPLETKQGNKSQKPFHGYLGQHPTVPLYESMGIDDADVAAKVNAFTEKQWPQGNKSFSTTIQSFSEKLSVLAITVRRMIMESFGLLKYMDEHLNSTNYLLRVMKYQGPGTEEPKLGLPAHMDSSMLTILYQNHVHGLEVQTKDKNWTKVKPLQDSFIVLIGVSFYASLNGRLHPPNHRVMMTGTTTRYSLALLSVPKVGHLLSSPDELVNEEHPRLYKPYEFYEFLTFFNRDPSQNSLSALHTYCGM